MGPRSPTNIAIGALIAVALVLAVMWTTASLDGHVRLALREFNTPPEFRGNHGPWRHAIVLSALHTLATLTTAVAALAAWIGVASESSRRAGIVAALAMLMILLTFAHFPLFD